MTNRVPVVLEDARVEEAVILPRVTTLIVVVTSLVEVEEELVLCEEEIVLVLIVDVVVAVSSEVIGYQIIIKYWISIRVGGILTSSQCSPFHPLLQRHISN